MSGKQIEINGFIELQDRDGGGTECAICQNEIWGTAKELVLVVDNHSREITIGGWYCESCSDDVMQIMKRKIESSR